MDRVFRALTVQPGPVDAQSALAYRRDRILMTLAAFGILLGLGLLMILGGLLLTLTVIGAVIGLPMILLGFFVLFAALALLVGKGLSNVVRF